MARHADAHAGAAAHAAPQPATRREAQPRALARVARRLRRLGGLLAQPEPPRGDRRYYSAQAAPAGSPPPADSRCSGNAAAAARRRPASAMAAARARAPPDGSRLAARALSEMLCDEPNAARCRATVRAPLLPARGAPPNPRAQTTSPHGNRPHRPTSVRVSASVNASQALGHGAAAALWQRALRDTAQPPGAEGGRAGDELALALATAMGDLFAWRGDDTVGRAVLCVGADQRFAAWYIAMAQASRPPRVTVAACYLLVRCLFSVGSCLGVRAAPRPRICVFK